jgi:CubicO group peptidase (beta-lactamase class C family)
MQTVDERTDTAGALEGIDQLVEDTMRHWKVPGMAVLVIRDGEVIHAQGYGLRDVERGLSVTPETVFAIGSCSKAFTTTSLAMLADEGKLDWDTPVREYLPDFRLKDPVATDGMTALDLVTHRSGLPGHELMWYGSGLSRREIYERLRYLDPNKGFRARFEYSNLSYMTAGVLVEALSGMSWEQFIRERIFAPLGMHDSNVSVEESKRSPNHSLPYGERDGRIQEIPFRNIDAIGPAGSINSTALNMAQWVLLQLNKGKRGETQLVSEGQLAKVHSPHIVADGMPQHEEIPLACYGLGWAVVPYRGHRLIWHTGGIDGFISMTSFLPDRNAGLVVLSNLDVQQAPSALSYDLVDRLLGLETRPWSERLKKQHDEMMEAAKKAQSAATRAEGTHPSHDLSAYAGEFTHPAYGPLSVVVSGDGLALNFHEKQYALTHRHYDVYDWDTGFFGQVLPLTFVTALDGSVGSVSIPFQPGIPEIVFTRVLAEKQEETQQST